MFEENLRKKREEVGKTQQELADELHVHRSLIAQYETGGKTPTIRLAVKMARMLGTTCEELVGATED